MPYDHHASIAASRREFLGGLAAFGAATLAAGGSAFGQPPAPSLGKLIDTHHHYYPPEIIKAWSDYSAARKEMPLGPLVAHWQPKTSLDEMDAGGVGSAVLSLASIPGVWFGLDTAGMRRMARLCNEFAAKMAADHPGRYARFAALPMPDVDGSLKEIEYAFEALKADGINLPTSFGDRWPGDPAFKPVFEELNRRKATVFFHPYAPNCCAGLKTGIPDGVLEFPYDTGRAIVSLLFSGTLARLRDIKYLFSHGGGVMPMLAGRVAFFAKFRKDIKEIAPQGVIAELQRLHYDTANAAWAPSMAGLLKLVPASQVVFGTDFPYLKTQLQKDQLMRDGLSPAVLSAIAHENALRLVPGLQA
jgi:6-methylsalicylate decarboxylase